MSVFWIYPHELFCIVMAFSYLCGNNLPIIILGISTAIWLTVTDCVLPGLNLSLQVKNPPCVQWSPAPQRSFTTTVSFTGLQNYYTIVIALVYDLAYAYTLFTQCIESKMLYLSL